MILCDIGNSCAKFQIDGEILRVGFNEFDAFCAKILSQNRRVFYINVNPKISNFAPNFIDLAPFVKFKSSYVGLGIDRVFGALFIENGVVIDAGSAITTDIMEHGRHVGGFIYPGFSALKNAFLSISPRLNLANPKYYEIGGEISDRVFVGKDSFYYANKVLRID